ncbi:MAG: hypothetical protein QOI67_965 [Gaiellaceae bacterium]|nr:hypothetical protein [Gaiellaceae bacterium]
MLNRRRFTDPRRLVVAIAAFAGIAAGTLVPSASTAITWAGNFESNDVSQFDSVYRVAADRIQVVSGTARQGSFSGRFEVRDGDKYGGWGGERAQVAKGGSATSGEGDESWWGWSVYLPNDYQDSTSFYQIFLEWHHNGLTGSPPVTFQVIKGRYVLRIVKSPDPAASMYWDQYDLGPAVLGQWADFTYHAKWSVDRTKALNEVWLNGAKVSTSNNPNLLSGFSNYVIAGWYRGDEASNTQVVYMDNLRRGGSYDELTAAPATTSGTTSTAATTATTGTTGSTASTTTATTTSSTTTTSAPPQPAPFVTSILKMSSEQTVRNGVPWEATASGAAVSRVDFYVDGQLRWTERELAFVFNGDGNLWDTRLESNGRHTLSVIAHSADGRSSSAKLDVLIDNRGNKRKFQ